MLTGQCELRFLLEPAAAFMDANETWQESGINFKLKNNELTATYANETERPKVMAIVDTVCDLNGIRNRQPIEYKLVHERVPAPEGTASYLKVHSTDTAKVKERVTISKQMIYGTARIVKDSAGLSQDSSIADKSRKYPELRKAIKQLALAQSENEPGTKLDNVVAVLSKALGSGSDGKKKLAEIAGVSRRYIGEITITNQTERHIDSYHNKLLTREERLARVQNLVWVYAKHLK